MKIILIFSPLSVSFTKEMISLNNILLQSGIFRLTLRNLINNYLHKYKQLPMQDMNNVKFILKTNNNIQTINNQIIILRQYLSNNRNNINKNKLIIKIHYNNKNLINMKINLINLNNFLLNSRNQDMVTDNNKTNTVKPHLDINKVQRAMSDQIVIAKQPLKDKLN